MLRKADHGIDCDQPRLRVRDSRWRIHRYLARDTCGHQADKREKMPSEGGNPQLKGGIFHNAMSSTVLAILPDLLTHVRAFRSYIKSVRKPAC